jgi:two-component system cell cycle response regulator DivK
VNNTVLVIEDNEQNLYLVRFLLEQHGFIVHEARDGMEGIVLASKLIPDLILLDIQLPMLDGYAVAAQLRLDPALRNTPIIAVMMGDREKVLAAGATGYIEKPIDPGAFVNQICKFLPQ